MGVDAADYDRSGHPSLIITNFANQMLSRFNNEGKGLFVDEAPRSEVGRATLVTLGFGCFFFDFDNDGWPDIFVADGHIEDQIERVQKSRYLCRTAALVSQSWRRKVSGGHGHAREPPLPGPKVARGAAFADIENDVVLDVLITTTGGPAHLYQNDVGANHSLRIKLEGTKSNRNGIGATVRLISGKDQQWQIVHSGSSYLSQSELVLTFGLGDKTKADSIEVQWPSGQVDKASNVGAGQTVTIQEGKGIVANKAYSKPWKVPEPRK